MWIDDLKQIDASRSGVLHIGAHDGREIPVYKTLGYQRIVAVEPIPYRAAKLAMMKGVEVVEAAVGERIRALHVTQLDERSSLYPPVDWSSQRIAVDVIPLSAFDLTGISLIVVDVQGAEVEVLSSGDISSVPHVVAEATETARYHGGCTQTDLDDLMDQLGFAVRTRYTHDVPGVMDTHYANHHPSGR